MDISQQEAAERL